MAQSRKDWNSLILDVCFGFLGFGGSFGAVWAPFSHGDNSLGFSARWGHFGCASSRQLTSRILKTNQDELCPSSAGSSPLTLASSAESKNYLIG